MQPPNEQDIMTLTPGQSLFNKNDVGGDVFIITEGEAEIYNVDSAGNETVLNVMKQGEIIGLASVLTRERRLASARAKTKMVVRKIEHDKFTKLLQTMPPWLKTVIKDMALRLDQMNQAFAEAKKQMAIIKRTQISCFFLASQMAGTVTAIGEFIAITMDDKKFIVIDTLIEKLELILAVEKELIIRIFEVFTECGVLRVHVEPEKKRKVVTLKNASDINSFGKFVQEYKGQKYRKLRKSRLANKEIRFLNGIVKLAVRLSLDLNSEVTLDIPQIEKTMEKSVGVKYDSDSVELSAEADLLKHDKEQDTIRFTPRALSHLLTNLAAYKRLEKLDQDVWSTNGKDAA